MRRVRGGAPKRNVVAPAFQRAEGSRSGGSISFEWMDTFTGFFRTTLLVGAATTQVSLQAETSVRKGIKCKSKLLLERLSSPRVSFQLVREPNQSVSGRGDNAVRQEQNSTRTQWIRARARGGASRARGEVQRAICRCWPLSRSHFSPLGSLAFF